MPAEFEIKISGLDETRKALFAYSDRLGQSVVLKALKAGARVTQKTAKASAPLKTGRLKRAIVVRNSKLYSKRKLKRTGKLGVYLTIRTGKGRRDPKDGYYGRFQEDGWNARGEYGPRYLITSVFGTRTGRKTLRSNNNIEGKQFIKRAFRSTRGKAAAVIIKSAEKGAEVLARRMKM